VFREAVALFPVEARNLRIEADRVTFYIKPADGFQLPEIMQWLKQTFAVRYNVMKRLDGHVWGDRYWSKGLEEGGGAQGAGRGDCGEDGGEGRAASGDISEARSEKGPPDGDSHREGETAGKTRNPPFFLRPLNRPPAASRPG
jgi:hypothetical protein